MSWKQVFGLKGVPGHRWDAAIKRVCPAGTYDDEVVSTVPTAPKWLKREEECTNPNDDAVVPEIDTNTENPKTVNNQDSEESDKENGSFYERTKVPKLLSSSSELEGLCPFKEHPNGTSEEDGLGQDYFVQDSPEDIKYSIEQKFLLEMPEDFFDLWECCSKINKEKPEEALSRAGLTLVGPYDMLNGKLEKLKTCRVSSYICHWRYYHDPPEFMTVIAGDQNEYHIGYYRDDPFQMPNFVASMSSVEPGNIKPLGENIFAGVCSYLSQKMKEENPFKKVPLERLYKEVEQYARSHDYPLQALTEDMKFRNTNAVAQGFHGAGIIERCHHDEGYRDSPETRAKLCTTFQKVVEGKTEEEQNQCFEDVRELINNVQAMYDEGEYGSGLELGINMLTFGGEVFHKSIFYLLAVAYDLLGKEPYVDIIMAHLKNRRRGSNMSILEVLE